MTTTRSGIPTDYAGTHFRSRLEARWAAFFDLVGWSWTYEPFDAEDYIPDFLIAGDAPFLVEVGPCITELDYYEKSVKPQRIPQPPTLVIGVAATFAGRAAGLIVNDLPGLVSPTFWVRCGSKLSIFSGDNMTRPCGHRGRNGHALVWDHDELTALWRRAGNDVQWKARRPTAIGEILRVAR